MGLHTCGDITVFFLCADDLSIHHGRPLTANLLFRGCLLAFQADCTVLSDKIITITGSQIERQQDNNTCLSYWLSNTAVLLNAAEQA